MDRRRHRVFVTRHTEYHLRANECVGVRDRATGQWIRRHAALRLRALRLPAPGDEALFVGQRLQLWGPSTDVITSQVEAVLRPGKETVVHYVSRVSVGEIPAAA